MYSSISCVNALTVDIVAFSACDNVTRSIMYPVPPFCLTAALRQLVCFGTATFSSLSCIGVPQVGCTIPGDVRYVGSLAIARVFMSMNMVGCNFVLIPRVRIALVNCTM